MRPLLILKLFTSFVLVYCESEEYGDDNNYQAQDGGTGTTVSTTTLTYFSDMPETMQINYIDALTFIQFDNKIERVMGLADDKCDNGIVNLATDFDPDNQTEVELCSKCLQEEIWKPDNLTEPILTIMNIPKRYVPIHKCMHVKIRYMEPIPTIGPHRPLWARYGEYKFVPPQRWMHNIEHGAIVGLYHPCADPDQVFQLKSIIKRCLFRHVITPYLNLTRERPIALVGWAASLEMSTFDYNLSKNFIKFYARTGPERVFRDGQYKKLLIDKARYVSNVIDEEVCPGM